MVICTNKAAPAVSRVAVGKLTLLRAPLSSARTFSTGDGAGDGDGDGVGAGDGAGVGDGVGVGDGIGTGTVVKLPPETPLDWYVSSAAMELTAIMMVFPSFCTSAFKFDVRLVVSMAATAPTSAEPWLLI